MRRIAVLLLAAVCLTGCSGEYVREGISRQNETPSVEVVSGGAVSGGVVSGQAVVAEKVSDKKIDIGRKYQFCNSTDLYVSSGEYENGIEHRRRDGAFVETLKPGKRGADEIWLALVEEDWLYYGRWYRDEEDTGGEESDELWRAPIQKGKEGDKVLLDQEEFIVKGKGEVYEGVFVIGDMLYYTDDEGYYKYDMKKKKQSTFAGKLPKKKWGEWLKPVGDTIVLYCEEGKEQKLYIHKNDSTGFQVLDDKYDDFWSEYVSVSDVGYMYYIVENDHQYEARVYRKKTGQTETLFTSEDFQRLLGEVPKSELYSGCRPSNVEGVYVDTERVYIELEVNSEKYEAEVMFSCEIGKEASTLKLESGVTDFLTMEEDGDWSMFDICDFMDGKQCVRGGLQDSKTESYELSTGKVRELTESDPEYWWHYYD